MRHIPYKYLLPFGIMGWLSFTSCDHKDLIEDDTFTGDVEIVFDWRNAPDANPASMVAFLIGNDTSDALRYNFIGRDGGTARVPEGTYLGLGFNSDITDWAKFRGQETDDSYELLTDDAVALNALSLSTESIPRVRDNDSERIANSPEQVWNDRLDNQSVKAYTPGQKIIFYPEEITCHYTVTVKDVKNINYLGGASVDATVSGLSESYFLRGEHRSTVAVTHPVILYGDPDTSTLHGEFLTFGDTDDHSSSNTLTIYLVYQDNSGSYATFDVTDQVKNAPDPRNVDIVVSGLELPKPINTGGGFIPNVTEWQGVEYNLQM